MNHFSSRETPPANVENRGEVQREDDENHSHSSDSRSLYSWPKRAALGLIWFYQSAISPFTPRACRFEPTCSHYAAQAIARFGVRRGGKLALKRICRCHPWGAFGLDPVPEHVSQSSVIEASTAEVAKVSNRGTSSTRCVENEQNAP